MCGRDHLPDLDDWWRAAAADHGRRRHRSIDLSIYAKGIRGGLLLGRQGGCRGLGGTTVVSDTAGATFAPVGGRLAGAFRRLRAVSAGTAYAAGGDGRVARTVDGGKSWTPIGVSTADDVRDVSFPTLSIGFALDSSGTALRTDNGGTTWRILNTGTTARPQSVLALDSRRVLLIGPRGIRRSTNGGEQFSAVRSRAIRNATLFDVDRAGGAVVVYGTQRLAVSTNGGSAWRAVRLPRGRGISEVNFTTPRAGCLLQQSGRLFTTRNGGRKWTEVLSLGSNSGAYMAFGNTRNGFVAADVADPFGGWPPTAPLLPRSSSPRPLASWPSGVVTTRVVATARRRSPLWSGRGDGGSRRRRGRGRPAGRRYPAVLDAQRPLRPPRDRAQVAAHLGAGMHLGGRQRAR